MPIPPLAQRILAKYYPCQTDPFRDLVEQRVKGKKRVLDAGCGDGRIFAYNFRKMAETLIGVDLRQDLAQNNQIHFATQGSIEQLPFENAVFDLIFSRFVLEHLRDPARAFQEFARTLRPGGTLIILVPNALHYFVIVARIIPHHIQQRIASWVGYREDDAFPTYYQANTCKKLNALANQAKLEIEKVLRHEPCPWFLGFSPFTLALATLYERLVNHYKKLAPFRAHIISIYVKPQSYCSTWEQSSAY